MKKRNGFVSNSSSSSFVIANNEEPTNVNFHYYELTGEMLERCQKEFDSHEIEVTDKTRFFLTQYLYDDNECYEELEEYPHFHFQAGAMSEEPYDENHYVELQEKIWLPMENVQGKFTPLKKLEMIKNFINEESEELDEIDAVDLITSLKEDFQKLLENQCQCPSDIEKDEG